MQMSMLMRFWMTGANLRRHVLGNVWVPAHELEALQVLLGLPVVLDGLLQPDLCSLPAQLLRLLLTALGRTHKVPTAQTSL